jgi:hypothetical protein
MASAQLSRRVEKVVGYPPLSELCDLQRREFHEALLEAATFEICLGSGRRRSWRRNSTARSCASPRAAEAGAEQQVVRGFRATTALEDAGDEPACKHY